MPTESSNFRPDNVPQPHGGAIELPSAVRAALRESAYERLRILVEIADDENAAARDRIAAINVMLELGLEDDVSIDDVCADG